VLAHQLEDVKDVPAATGKPEHERTDAQNRDFGQRGDAGEPAARAERQRGEHYDPLRDPGLLGESRRGQQRPGRDGTTGAAHPPGGIQAANAERQEQRVDPADVEPRLRGEVDRGEHARGAGPGRGASRLALDQPAK
jgi:hypothetical protein